MQPLTPAEWPAEWPAATTSGGGNFTLSAWAVRYPWREGRTSSGVFTSSDATLNAVWNLCRDTLRSTSLDTTTDSNTRERLPYEADAYITGLSRLALQAEYEWPRHSWMHTLRNPTWPTEWRQTAALMAHADWYATGELDVYSQLADALSAQTQRACLNATTGLIDFRACPRQTGGLGCGHEAKLRDLVDWPPVYRDGFVLSDAANTVVNAYAVGGLRAMAEMVNASGNASGAAELADTADRVADGVNALLWDDKSGAYRDGLASTGAPIDHTAWHASVFAAAFGLVPSSRWPALLALFRRRGMVGSVYAAFFLLQALYQAPHDHGQLALEVLTSCSKHSWCNMLREGATATMEAWSPDEKPNLSWSHPWASAPASAVVWGLFGVRPLQPGWKTVEVRPQPGNLSWATIRVPSIRGPISIAFNQSAAQSCSRATEQAHLQRLSSCFFHLTLQLPRAMGASVCLPRLGRMDSMLRVDGVPASGRLAGDFVCINVPEDDGDVTVRLLRDARE